MAEFIPTVVTECLRIVVCTRNRNFNNEEYQKGVVEPYKKIEKMQEEIEKNQSTPTKDQMLEALEMLKTVFETKKVPNQEQIERFNEIFEKTNTKEMFPEFKYPIEDTVIA
jgi:[acyl-carrier-protein] S-malonyltransferase